MINCIPFRKTSAGFPEGVHLISEKCALCKRNIQLNRLEKYKENHLLFAEDFRVPFDDNMSERDLRKAKNRQKMSGGFRKGSRQKMY